LAGNSLGLLPKKGKEYINAELDKWAQLGVKGHFEGDRPWADIDEHEVKNFLRELCAGGSHLLVFSFKSCALKP